MGAFIAAGFAFVIGTGFSLLVLFAYGMSDNGYDNQSAGREAAKIFIPTMIIVVLVASSHWWAPLIPAWKLTW